jgi:hypothetical protein
MTPPTTVALSLVSHTNAGKTTLARTLLRRDIGEVRDAAHVTQQAERFTMVETPEGDRLELWDTPGFGDSQRLARRLAQAGNPIGWFLGEVWDRLRDRPFWLNQRALRHVLAQADVVLYLVNASEAPEDAAYLEPELRILGLIGKPVVVLLNQLGAPRPPAEEAAEIDRWRTRTADHACVRGLLAFDAFARCWVAEGVLLRSVAHALPPDRAEGFARLRQAWTAGHAEVWRRSMGVLAERLARAAHDREPVPAAGLGRRVQALGAALGWRREGAVTPREEAMQALAERLDADVRRSTERLVALHGLDGQAERRVLAQLAEHYAAQQPVDTGTAAVLGGVLTGALAGLKADLATGGLTLGGGLLVGGVLGALGAAGLARGYNQLRGVEQPTLAWTDAVLDDAVRAALLLYLAVAHHGRGRGEWRAEDGPADWEIACRAALAPHTEALHRLWTMARHPGAEVPPGAPMPMSTREPLERLLTELSGTLLLQLHPDARPEDLGR